MDRDWTQPLTAWAAKPPPGFDEPSALEQALETLNPDGMTPKEALEALYRLKTLLESKA